MQWIELLIPSVLPTIAGLLAWHTSAQVLHAVREIHTLCNSRLDSLRQELKLAHGAAIKLEEQSKAQAGLVLELKGQITSLNAIVADLHKQIRVLKVGMLEHDSERRGELIEAVSNK